MKVTLVNPAQPELLKPTSYIPLGLAYLAASLERSGHQVKVVNLADPQIKPESILNSEIIGISCVTATRNQVKKLIQFIRFAGDHYIMLGGIEPTVRPELNYKELQPDVLVMGEADERISEIIQKQPKGIIDVGLVTNLNKLPFPARHLFPDKHVIDYTGIHGQPSGIPATAVITSRGCPFMCTFCCKNHQMFTVHRWRDPWNVIAELEFLKARYGIKHFRFIDDAFATNTKRAFILCELLQKIGLSWVCITRIDSLTKKLLRLMADAKCLEIHIGMECASDPMLKNMNKRISRKQLIDGIRLIQQVGIKVKVYLMFNYPGETEEDRKATIKFMEEMKPDKFTLSRFTPLPGSAIYDELKGTKRLPNRKWFYPDETDIKYLKYKQEIMDVLKK